MIYTHIFRSGNPSRFATLDGLREIITHLPNQDESAKIKYHSLFNEYFTHLRAPTAFEVATQEQSFHDIEDDDAVPEIQTEGVKGSAHSNDGNTLFVTPKMYVECIINHNETEKKLFQEKLDMAMKTASLEKDKALLQMQLKMQEEKAALQRELDLERPSRGSWTGREPPGQADDRERGPADPCLHGVAAQAHGAQQQHRHAADGGGSLSV